jgi:hypothetical protein
MDRNGDQWTGDEIAAEAHGEGAASGGGSHSPDKKPKAEESVARQRSIDTAAEDAVRPDDEADLAPTTAGSGATREGE